MVTDIGPAKTGGSSMVLRILAFVLGTPIFLVGLLATYVAVDLMLNPAPGKQHALAVHIIGIAIMVVPVVVGALLLKFSLLPKKRSQQLNQSKTPPPQDVRPMPPEVQPTEQTEEQPTDRTFEEVEAFPPSRPESAVTVLSPATKKAVPASRREPAFEFPSSATTRASAAPTGQLLAECGPKKSGQTHYIVIGFLMIVLGCVAMAIPEKIVPPKKPADAGMIRTAGLCFGGVITLFGLGMMAGPLFGPAQRIRLYDDKLVEEKGNRTREIGFDGIASVEIQEWYEHRFAPQTFKVKVKVSGQPDLAFSSALVGNSERIIRFLAEHSSDTQVTEFA